MVECGIQNIPVYGKLEMNLMTPHFLNRDKGKLVSFPTDPVIYLILICMCKLLANSHASITNTAMCVKIMWKGCEKCVKKMNHVKSMLAKIQVHHIGISHACELFVMHVKFEVHMHNTL